jgi:hypothetical protein
MNRTPTNKTKGKTSRNEYKESIPFEYNKDIIAPNFDDKSTPSRPSREASPNLRFMSPTLNSKQRSSNQKNRKNKTKVDDVYTIEDLDSRALAQRELSKKSNLDKVDLEKENASYMERITEQRQNAANLAMHKTDDNYAPSDDFISINANSMKASFKSNKSEDEYLGGNMKLNTPGFYMNEVTSKLSTIEKNDDSKKYTDRDMEEIVYTMNDKKSKKMSKPKIEKKNKKANAKFNNREEKKYKVLESPLRSSYPTVVSPSKDTNKSSNKGECDKGRQEIVPLMHNPNMLFNDASSIKYSIDNQNMSNFSLPSIAANANKPSFDNLDGMCYDLISAFVGDRFPQFIFANKKICNTFLDFQLEINDEVLSALNDRIDQSTTYSVQSLSYAENMNPSETMNKLKKKKAIFSLSDNCHDKF